MHFSFLARAAISIFLTILISVPAYAQGLPTSDNGPMLDNANAQNTSMKTKKKIKKVVKKKIIKKVIKKKSKKILKEKAIKEVQLPQEDLTQNQTQPTVISEPTTITISGFSYAPANVTLKKGTVVTFLNNDTAPHTATATNGAFASPSLSQGDSFKFTFDTVGTFEYFCALHTGMKAQLTVVE